MCVKAHPLFCYIAPQISTDKILFHADIIITQGMRRYNFCEGI